MQKEAHDSDKEQDDPRDWSAYTAKNRDVQLMLETLIDLWAETLVAGKHIEVENFLLIETQTIDRGEQRGVRPVVLLQVSSDV